MTTKQPNPNPPRTVFLNDLGPSTIPDDWELQAFAEAANTPYLWLVVWSNGSDYVVSGVHGVNRSGYRFKPEDRADLVSWIRRVGKGLGNPALAERVLDQLPPVRLT